eukprot:s5242_g2.t1
MQHHGGHTATQSKLLLFQQLKASGKSQKLQVVERLRLNGFLTDAKEYTVAINAVGRADAWPQALGLLGALLQEGLQANEISFGTAINSVKSWITGLSLLDELVQRGLPLSAAHVTALIRVLNLLKPQSVN